MILACRGLNAHGYVRDMKHAQKESDSLVNIGDVCSPPKRRMLCRMLEKQAC